MCFDCLKTAISARYRALTKSCANFSRWCLSAWPQSTFVKLDRRLSSSAKNNRRVDCTDNAALANKLVQGPGSRVLRIFFAIRVTLSASKVNRRIEYERPKSAISLYAASCSHPKPSKSFDRLYISSWNYIHFHIVLILHFCIKLLTFIFL